MTSLCKTLFYPAILLLLPMSVQAEIKVYIGVPTYSHNRNYYPGNNYQRNYYNAYSNNRNNDLSDIHRRYGNKHEYDRMQYYRNKYPEKNTYTSPRITSRYQNAYRQGFLDGQRYKSKKRTYKIGK